MDLQTVSFDDFSPLQVRNLLREFLDIEEKYDWVDGNFIRHRKFLSSEFIQDKLGCTPVIADNLLAELINKGYIDRTRLTPLPSGMALANSENRPRISRQEAEQIISDIIAAAERLNDREGARVFVESIDVFGSYLSDRPDLGDIDVFATIPLPEDFTDVDVAEQEEVEKTLEVSEYVSLHSEFDLVAADAQKLNIYTRKHQ